MATKTDTRWTGKNNQVAYRGYLIRFVSLHAPHYTISKGDVHISWATSAADAESIIDSLVG